MFAASLIGAIFGMYLTRRLRAKSERRTWELRLPKQVEQNLMTILVLLATFTLIEDISAIFDFGWNLSPISTLEVKYGFILAVLVAILGKRYFERENSGVDVAKGGS
jgi:hypothetical protein